MNQPLSLYARLAADDAISAFGPTAQGSTLCDGDFTLLPGAALGFMTLGASLAGPTLESPSMVIWRPRRPDYGGGAPYPWLPTPLREIKRPTRHHLFLRNASQVQYIYAGPAHLGCYGGPSASPSATFYLDQPLPRAVWLELGGYSGWSIELNHSLHRLDSLDHVTFQGLLDSLVQSPYGHMSITRYEQNSLHVYTNPTRAWLMYLREPVDSGLYLSQEPVAEATREEQFKCACGINLDQPYSQTVPHEDAFTLVREFFNTGNLPTRVAWVES